MKRTYQPNTRRRARKHGSVPACDPGRAGHPEGTPAKGRTRCRLDRPHPRATKFDAVASRPPCPSRDAVVHVSSTIPQLDRHGGVRHRASGRHGGRAQPAPPSPASAARRAACVAASLLVAPGRRPPGAADVSYDELDGEFVRLVPTQVHPLTATGELAHAPALVAMSTGTSGLSRPAHRRAASRRHARATPARRSNVTAPARSLAHCAPLAPLPPVRSVWVRPGTGADHSLRSRRAHRPTSKDPDVFEVPAWLLVLVLRPHAQLRHRDRADRRRGDGDHHAADVEEHQGHARDAAAAAGDARLQQQHRGDRQKLNEEMMKLYQEHKVNPMASCLPLLAQMPVFFIMFRVLRGLTYEPIGERRDGRQALLRRASGRTVGRDRLRPPLHLHGERPLPVAGRQERDDVVRSGSVEDPIEMIGEGFGKGLIYALLVVLPRPRCTSSSSAWSPPAPRSARHVARAAEDHAVPAGRVRRLPAVLPAGLVIYYITQALLRIGQQAYITRRFYGHDESLGRQAQRAGGAGARDGQGQDGGGGLFGPGQDATCAGPRADAARAAQAPSRRPRRRAIGRRRTSKRTTAPKAGRRRRRQGDRRTATGRPSGVAAKSGGKRSRKPRSNDVLIVIDERS